ncbi:hypothetical protein LCGC14_2869570 [marine sediment metagenome]|uniref:Uncharacterized protein n=1 Tax=marine sediment metagenome TaxID=412755 RepID=A0A0F9ABM4_9ZZZZ
MTKILESRRMLDRMMEGEPPDLQTANAGSWLIQSIALVEIAETLHYMAEIMVESMGTTGGIQFRLDQGKEPEI